MRYATNGVSIAEYKDAMWGKWEGYSNLAILFKEHYFVIYQSSYHPSEYTIKVTCNTSSENKDGQLYKYTGKIEIRTTNTTLESYDAEIWIRHSKFGKIDKGHTINVFYSGIGIAIAPKSN